MEIRYRPIHQEDYPDIIKLTDACINNEKEYHEYIKDLLEKLNSTVVGVMALDNDKPIGIAICVKGMELTAGREDFFSQIRSDIGEEEIWSGSVVAVDSEYRKLSIGSKIQKVCFKEIIKHKGRHLLLELWVHSDGIVPAQGTLKLVPSYTDYGIVTDFYNVPQLEGHVCSICGPVCHCGARIVVLHLLPKIEYRLAQESDFEQVLEISSKYINASEPYSNYIKELHSTLGTESMEMLAFYGERLIGLVSAKEGMHLTGDRQDFYTDILRDIGSDIIWSNVFIVVDPEFQQYRIASELQNRLNAELSKIGVKHLICEIWCRPDGYMPSRGLLKYTSVSYTEYGLVDNFYKDIPHPEGIECQICGKVCHCKALIAVTHI